MRLPREMIGIAGHIIETKTGDFDPAYLEDRYRTSLVSLLREKKAQAPAPAPAVPSSKNVINLMEVLKRSLSAERQTATGTKSSLRRAAAAARTDSGTRSKRQKKGD